jgi:hypothetical protein
MLKGRNGSTAVWEAFGAAELDQVQRQYSQKLSCQGNLASIQRKVAKFAKPQKRGRMECENELVLSVLMAALRSLASLR